MTISEIHKLVKADAPTLDQAQAISEYLTKNPTVCQHQLARLVGLSQTRVHMLNHIAQLPVEIKQEIRTTGIRYAIQKLYEVAHMDPSEQVEAFHKLKPARKVKLTYNTRW